MVSTRFLFTVMPLSGALAQAWDNWQEADYTVTTTVQKTKYVCPCDSTSSAWEAWMTASSTSTKPYEQWSSASTPSVNSQWNTWESSSSSTKPYEQWSSVSSASWDEPATWSWIPATTSTPSAATWYQWQSSATTSSSTPYETWSSWQSSATPSSSYASWSSWQSSATPSSSTYETWSSWQSSSTMTTSTYAVTWMNWQSPSASTTSTTTNTVIVDPISTTSSSSTSSTSSTSMTTTTPVTTTTTSSSTTTTTTTSSLTTTTTTSSTTSSTTTTSSSSTTTIVPLPIATQFTLQAFTNPFVPDGSPGYLVLDGPFNEEYLTFGAGVPNVLAIDSGFYLKDPATGQFANIVPGYSDQVYFSSLDAINNFGYSQVQCQVVGDNLVCAAGLNGVFNLNPGTVNALFNLDANGNLYLSQVIPADRRAVNLRVNGV